RQFGSSQVRSNTSRYPTQRQTKRPSVRKKTSTSLECAQVAGRGVVDPRLRPGNRFGRLRREGCFTGEVPVAPGQALELRDLWGWDLRVACHSFRVGVVQIKKTLAKIRGAVRYLEGHAPVHPVGRLPCIGIFDSDGDFTFPYLFLA